MRAFLNAVYALEQQITCLWLFEKHRSINFLSLFPSFFLLLIMCYIIETWVFLSRVWVLKRFFLSSIHGWKRRKYLNIIQQQSDEEEKGKYRIKEENLFHNRVKTYLPSGEKKGNFPFSGENKKIEVSMKWSKNMLHMLWQKHTQTPTPIAPEERRGTEKETPKQTLIKESKAFM